MDTEEFEAALAAAIMRELHITVGADDALGGPLRAVAAATPGSTARTRAIGLARLAFALHCPVVDEGMGQDGPACPACGTDMNVEVMSTRNGLRGCERCPRCDLTRLMPDLFEM